MCTHSKPALVFILQVNWSIFTAYPENKLHSVVCPLCCNEQDEGIDSVRAVEPKVKDNKTSLRY